MDNAIDFEIPTDMMYTRQKNMQLQLNLNHCQKEKDLVKLNKKRVSTVLVKVKQQRNK